MDQLVAGVAPASMSSGGGRRCTAGDAEQSEGRREKMRMSIISSPGARGRGRWRTGRPDGEATVPGAAAGGGEGMGDAGDWRRPGPILCAGMEEAMVRSSGQH